jgi:hypothetical protein
VQNEAFDEQIARRVAWGGVDNEVLIAEVEVIALTHFHVALWHVGRLAVVRLLGLPRLSIIFQSWGAATTRADGDLRAPGAPKWSAGLVMMMYLMLCGSTPTFDVRLDQSTKGSCAVSNRMLPCGVVGPTNPRSRDLMVKRDCGLGLDPWIHPRERADTRSSRAYVGHFRIGAGLGRSSEAFAAAASASAFCAMPQIHKPGGHEAAAVSI